MSVRTSFSFFQFRIRVASHSLPTVAVTAPVLEPGIASCGANSVVFVCYSASVMTHIFFIQPVERHWLFCASS